MNKREKPIPNSVAVKYADQDRLNKFQPQRDSPRRFVAETFTAGDRNHKIPTTTSPLMMTSGVAPIDKVKEFGKTQEKLEVFTKRSDFVLQNQGPTVLPLAGKAGSPLKLVQRTNSVQLCKDLASAEKIKGFEPFRANQYKETLPI